MKKMVMFALILILLQACSAKEVIRLEDSQKAAPQERTAMPVANETAPTAKTASNLMPEFKIMSEYGKRSPPSINGTIRNIGNATGDAKITAKVYYAGVIASERTATVNNIKVGEDAKFGIGFDKTTVWNSYKLSAEPVK